MCFFMNPSRQSHRFSVKVKNAVFEDSSLPNRVDNRWFGCYCCLTDSPSSACSCEKPFLRANLSPSSCLVDLVVLLACGDQVMTLLIYLFQHQGTVKGPSHNQFQPTEVAKNLRKTFKGLGTNEKVIIDALAAHTNWQRQEIKRAFGQLYGRNLVSSLEDELGGHFLETCLALMLPPHIYDSHCLRKAMKSSYVQGVGTNEVVLIEILCSRTHAEIGLIKDAYKQEYDRVLEDDILAETSPHLAKLIQSVITGKREVLQELDIKMCEKDAARLIQVGIKSTETVLLNEILTTRNTIHLAKVFDLYRKTSGQDIEQEIRKNFVGDMKDAYIALVKLIRNPPCFFAEKLHESLRGSSNSDDDTIIRIIVSRSEVDLQQIKEEYIRKYKKTLTHSVRDDTSGDYSRLLVKIIGRE